MNEPEKPKQPPTPGELEFFEQAYREAGRRAFESRTIEGSEYYRGVQDGLLAWAVFVKLGISSEILQ